MPAEQVCHNFLKKSLENLHKYRFNALISIAMTLTRGASLTLTSMGRHMTGHAKVKHKIKRVDRFLGNTNLHKDIPAIYSNLIKVLTKPLKHCLIIVDWSGCCQADYHMLRASLAYQGRAIPIFTKVVPQSKLGNHRVHAEFLESLHQMMGSEKEVTIMTDAGFITPWFELVRALNWDFIGRIRGNTSFNIIGTSPWLTAKKIASSATNTTRYLGEGIVGKERKKCRGHFYLYKGKNKGRSSGKLQHTHPRKEYSESSKEPWLIVSSSPIQNAKKVIQLYSKRMQIEQNFRDEKSPRFGFAWRESRCNNAERISVLCLLSAVASIFL